MGEEFGIPGDAVTAVIIGALVIHGLNPGPMLMVESPHIFWFTVGNLALAIIFLLVFGLMGITLVFALLQGVWISRQSGAFEPRAGSADVTKAE